MLKLEDFKSKKIDSTNLVTGGSDPNVTPGGSRTVAILPGYYMTQTWSSDYDGVDGREWCDVETTFAHG